MFDNGWNVTVEVALVVVVVVVAVAVAVVHETVYFQVLHQYEFLGVHNRDYTDSILWFWILYVSA